MEIAMFAGYGTEEAMNDVEDHPTDQSRHSKRPTVGQLRLPDHKGSRASQDTVVYLDMLPSDGDETKWPERPGYTAEDIVTFKGKFVSTFNTRPELQALCGGPFDIRMLPVGYRAMRSARGSDQLIYGHPSGLHYKSMARFAPHLASIMEEDLPNCSCDPCSGPWRRNAPAHAAIRVGLPGVPGGAVAAAIARSGARREEERALGAQSPTNDILAADLSWTDHTKGRLHETLDFVRRLSATLEDIDAVILVQVTDHKEFWEDNFAIYFNYVSSIDVHTEELDAVWQKWINEQLDWFGRLKSQRKTQKAAQESSDLLRRARDVMNLPEWKKGVVNQAIEYIAKYDEDGAGI